MDGLEEKAKASGACLLVVKDLKEEFVKDYIFPCLRAGVMCEREYLLGTSMAGPVIAKVISQFDSIYVGFIINSLPSSIANCTAESIKKRLDFLTTALALPGTVLCFRQS